MKIIVSPNSYKESLSSIDAANIIISVLKKHLNNSQFIDLPSDELIYHNNLKFIRDFIKWNEKNGYELVIGEKNKKKSLVKWKISLVNNKTYLSITVYPYLMNQYPKIMSFLPYLIYIKPMLKSYLNSVLMGINWYLKTKKPVSKNQFGKHKWFS